jgi:hypothetical protein
MRIELPPGSWADTAQRVEDDAHTLTVAAHVAADWVQWQWPANSDQTLRIEVPADQPRRLTITF